MIFDGRLRTRLSRGNQLQNPGAWLPSDACSQRDASRTSCELLTSMPFSSFCLSARRRGQPTFRIGPSTATTSRAASPSASHTATDLVVIDKSGLLFAEDLVRNDPFLRHRPKVLDLTLLDEANLADLCARYCISMFGRRQGLAFGISSNDEQTKFDDDVRAKKKAVMARLSCGVDMAVSANEDTRF